MRNDPLPSGLKSLNPHRIFWLRSLSAKTCLSHAVVRCMLMVFAGWAIPAMAGVVGWTQDSKVTKLVNTSDGGVNVFLSPPPSGCVSNSGYGPAVASIYPNHPGINRMKADLLIAHLTDRKVALYFVDNTCRVGEMILGGWE